MRQCGGANMPAKASPKITGETAPLVGRR
jgi:hypothetical protein